MFDFHEKRKIRSIVYSKTVFALLIIIAIFLSVSVYNRYIVAQETKMRFEERQADLQALEARAEVLSSKVEYLENERGIEEELRNRFDVAKEGEQVVIILEDKKKKQESNVAQPEHPVKEESGLKSILKLFKFW